MSLTSHLRKQGKLILNFLKSPGDFKYNDVSNSNKLKAVLRIVLIELIVVIPVGLIVYGMEEAGILFFPDHAIEELVDKMSIALVLLGAVVFAPIVEEILFRGFITLRRFYPLILVIDLAEALGKNRFRTLRIVLRVWTNCFPIIVYASIFAFGYAHVWNFKEEMPFWLIPIAVSPQLVAGLFLTYTRVRYGLIWSMLSHATTNLIFLVLYYTVPLG
ncbi:CPBP family intramembrane glutamic endopeptidase [Ekhidna sp.]|uniref:CPBP family intramembrane glutamic endopeptidase n=1 Tax=Ekhidna sp. TaxID=2608089 RepID=UPI003513A7D4